jgi:fructose-bisphosphate aldolase class II
MVLVPFYFSRSHRYIAYGYLFYKEEWEMPLVNGREVLEAAVKGKYAVGAFNANSMEYVQAIIEAAEEEQAPVFLQISQGAIRYAGLEMAVAMVKVAAEQASVPVVLHLDHGTDFDQNIKCLRAGFTSLMFDGSDLPLEENKAITRKIVEVAHAVGLPVEAELGKIPRIEDFKDLLPPDYDFRSPVPPSVLEKVVDLMAKPEDVEDFVSYTQCDSLAAAVGSIHGMKEDIQPLCIERLKQIRERTNIPLVSHGSSGIIPTWERFEELKKQGFEFPEGWGPLEEAIKYGIAKINVATEISMSFLEGMKKAWDKNPGEKDSRRITGPGRDAMKERIKWYMRLFGCSGKARDWRARKEEAGPSPEGPE